MLQLNNTTKIIRSGNKKNHLLDNINVAIHTGDFISLIAKPKLILADKPTGNLNSKQSTEIMKLFTKLTKEGVTIIQATHSEKNANYGSTIINLLDGTIVTTKLDILTSFLHIIKVKSF